MATKIEQDISSIKEAIVEIKGQFDLFHEKLSSIKEDTEKTNGRVNKHDTEIRLLQKTDSIHLLNCPNTKPVAELMAIKKNWKVYAIAAMATGFVIFMSTYVSYISFLGVYKQGKMMQTEMQAVKKETQENAAQIKDNKTNINSLDVEQASKKSLEENK